MTHLEEMFTPPASASYAQVEAYEIGRIMGRTDRQLSLKHVQRGPWGDYMTSEAAWQGYEAGWAETVPDDR